MPILIALITYRTLCIVDPISLTPSISSYESLRLRPYAQEDIYKYPDKLKILGHQIHFHKHKEFRINSIHKTYKQQ